ncbi:MAG: hypothetical protein NT069_10305 [Planctomycetota bacterium]|nr:hypothetical protein [Planctomycetota bacterium]
MQKSTTRKPYTLAGAGPLTATVWKFGSEQCGWNYRFNVVKTNDVNGEVTQQFCAGDIRNFAKLIQVLAFTLADDGCLEPEYRTELSELASRLRTALESRPSTASPEMKECEEM